jgi:hypothetical protein
MGHIAAIVAKDEAQRLIDEARSHGLTLRLMGGIAVFLHSYNMPTVPELDREYADLDFIGLSKETPQIIRFFSGMGYQPHQRFNTVMGGERLLFAGSGKIEHVDVILNTFRMCHSWDLRARLTINNNTIPLADLLLSKLQIVELTEKDLKDICRLLIVHELGPTDEEQFNTVYLSSLLGNDWGLWQTVTINLLKALKYIEHLHFGGWEIVANRLTSLQQLADEITKSPRWKIRAAIGKRIKWYELPGNIQY